MRILHSSDWHLGQFFYGKSRAAEHQKFLTWLLQQVELLSVDAIIVAGDIFDTGTPPSYAREMYYDFVVALKSLHCQLFILAGNHDSVAMLGESRQLLATLSTQVVTVIADEPEQQIFAIKNRAGECAALLCAIPFIRPRDVSSSQAGQQAEHKQQALRDGIAQHYQRLYARAKQLAAEHHDVPVLMTGHLTAVGVSRTDSVRDIYIGTLEAFPASAFPDADYIALGHIHQAQRVANSEHIRYSGSPIPLSFDEATQQKVVLLLEFDQQQALQVQEIAVPCFQPLAMLRSSLDDLPNRLAELSEQLGEHQNGAQSVWLDIEIDSSGYLADLQPRISAMTAELPVEVLLVRRSKQARQQLDAGQENITLDELTLNQVFEHRLAQEVFDGEQASERKQRLVSLYHEVVADIEHEGKQ